MTADKKFKITLIKWLCKNGFSNIDIDFEEDFSYAFDNTISCINIGIIDQTQIGIYFEQFLYEYGCEYVGIPYPILSFLHELAHTQTISNFTDEELLVCAFSKELRHTGTEQEQFFYYWETPDEFAANMWVIDFINHNIEKVQDLTNLFINAWIELTKYINVFDLIKE